MYAVLKFNTWGAPTQVYAAIMSIMQGNTLAAAGTASAGQLSVTGSKLVGNAASDAWTFVDSSTLMVPNSTVNSQNKYIRFTGLGVVTVLFSKTSAFGSTDTFAGTSSSAQTILTQSNLNGVSNSANAPLLVHLSFSKHHFMLATMSQATGAVQAITILSEVDYGVSDYLDDASNTYSPIVSCCNIYGGSIYDSATPANTTGKWSIPKIITNLSTGATATRPALDWRVGNKVATTNPLADTGNASCNADLTYSTSLLPLGVAYNTQFHGDITSKSGIRLYAGTGPNDITYTPNDIVTVSGVPYRILNKIAVPYI